jgi:hypothetical protein
MVLSNPELQRCIVDCSGIEWEIKTMWHIVQEVVLLDESMRLQPKVGMTRGSKAETRWPCTG